MLEIIAELKSRVEKTEKILKIRDEGLEEEKELLDNLLIAEKEGSGLRFLRNYLETQNFNGNSSLDFL